VFHQTASQILVEASATCFFCGTEVIEVVLFGNFLEICLFIFGIKDFDEAFCGLKCALWLFGRALINAIAHGPGLVSCCSGC
jgi:hypothetical protein